MPRPDSLMVALWCLGAFLAGSIPFGLIVVKLAGKGDVREVGSGNIGATNVSRAGGMGLGVLVLGLDILKGFLPVILAKTAGFPVAVLSITALAAVLGHMFTPWLRLRGGKGVATALGVALAFDPMLIVPSLGVFVVVLLLTRFVSLGSILASAAIPVTLFLRAGPASTVQPWWELRVVSVVLWCCIALLVIVKHHDNLRRLLQGTESKLWGGNGKGA